MTQPREVAMRREPQLAGQSVVVIGGSSGIGLETARRAREEGADVIITARDPDRLHRAGLWVLGQHRGLRRHRLRPAREVLRRLRTPIDHVPVTGPGPSYASLAEFDLEAARRDIEAHLLLPSQVAWNAATKVGRGGTLLFMGGTRALLRYRPGEWPVTSTGAPGDSKRHAGSNANRSSGGHHDQHRRKS